VAEDEKRTLRIFASFVADEAGEGAVVGKHRLEVSLKYEGAIAIGQEHAARLNHTPERFTDERRVLAEVLRDRGSAPRGTRVVSRIGEASEPFEENLELEQLLNLVFDWQTSQPRIARSGLLAAKTAGIAKEIVVDVASLQRPRSRRASEGHEAVRAPGRQAAAYGADES
jgi:hypothetical protein